MIHYIRFRLKGPCPTKFANCCTRICFKGVLVEVGSDYIESINCDHYIEVFWYKGIPNMIKAFLCEKNYDFCFSIMVIKFRKNF